MTNLNTFFPAARRVRRQRGALIATQQGLRVVGVVDVGPYDDGLVATVVLETTEDQPLEPPGDASPDKWNAVWDGNLYLGVALDRTAYDRLRVRFAMIEPAAGEDVIHYTNAPSDISDVNGRMLAAFAWAV